MTRAEMLFEILQKKGEEDKIWECLAGACPHNFGMSDDCQKENWEHAICFLCWMKEVK